MTIGPLAETYREADQRPIIVEDIICVVEKRLRKAHSLIACQIGQIIVLLASSDPAWYESKSQNLINCPEWR